jgi:hypothetical protein
MLKVFLVLLLVMSFNQHIRAAETFDLDSTLTKKGYPNQHMCNIEIFDLDGTLTKKGYSLWNLINRELVDNIENFDAIAAIWNIMVVDQSEKSKKVFLNVFRRITNEPDDIDWQKLAGMAIDKNRTISSLAIIEIGLKMLRPGCRDPKVITDTARKITTSLPESVIILEAIKYLSHRLKSGTICVISTGGYEEAGKGFIEGLVERNLLSASLLKNIRYSGTQIDWEKLKVIHVNVNKNKILGLVRVFKSESGDQKYSIEKLKKRINAVFGDDILINDLAILKDLCKCGFVIKNKSNESKQLPSNCILTGWPQIYNNRDNLATFHKESAGG